MANISNSQQTLPDIKFYRSFALNHSYTNYFFVILGKLVMERLHKANGNKLIFCFFLGILISINISAQNWNVFNKQYRYNYIYENNSLITNVLFADSVKQIGNDSVYFMNRIGIECTGTCPTITTAITTTAMVIVPNMPQFLQRTIIKYSNGLVMLKDTAKQVIKPNCILNETWLFDSVNNKNAQCINLSTQTIFSITDSIKTILIDGTDTLKLSKQFGIIKFPNVYNKNKYYRLVGIENTASYEQASLYGSKVPNEWNFYNFDVGDKFCYAITDLFNPPHGDPGHNITANMTLEILSKTFIPAIGYNYTVKKEIQTVTQTSTNPLVAFNSTITTINYTLNTLSMANVMYPNQIIISAVNVGSLVKFGTDNNGKFYKFFGPNCQNYTNVTLPNNNGVTYYNSNGSYYEYSFDPHLSKVFGEGLGSVTDIVDWSGVIINKQCLTCAIKNNLLYLGTEIFVGQKENNASLVNSLSIFPNPTSDKIIISSNEKIIKKIELINSIGQIILVREINESTVSIDLKNYEAGIYFIKITDHFGNLEIKKIFKE
jgi:hypothetical protein